MRFTSNSRSGPAFKKMFGNVDKDDDDFDPELKGMCTLLEWSVGSFGKTIIIPLGEQQLGLICKDNSFEILEDLNNKLTTLVVSFDFQQKSIVVTFLEDTQKSNGEFTRLGDIIAKLERELIVLPLISLPDCDGSQEVLLNLLVDFYDKSSLILSGLSYKNDCTTMNEVTSYEEEQVVVEIVCKDGRTVAGARMFYPSRRSEPLGISTLCQTDVALPKESKKRQLLKSEINMKELFLRISTSYEGFVEGLPKLFSVSEYYPPKTGSNNIDKASSDILIKQWFTDKIVYCSLKNSDLKVKIRESLLCFFVMGEETLSELKNHLSLLSGMIKSGNVVAAVDDTITLKDDRDVAVRMDGRDYGKEFGKVFKTSVPIDYETAYFLSFSENNSLVEILKSNEATIRVLFSGDSSSRSFREYQDKNELLISSNTSEKLKLAEHICLNYLGGIDSISLKCLKLETKSTFQKFCKYLSLELGKYHAVDAVIFIQVEENEKNYQRWLREIYWGNNITLTRKTSDISQLGGSFVVNILGFLDKLPQSFLDSFDRILPTSAVEIPVKYAAVEQFLQDISSKSLLYLVYKPVSRHELHPEEEPQIKTDIKGIITILKPLIETEMDAVTKLLETSRFFYCKDNIILKTAYNTIVKALEVYQNSSNETERFLFRNSGKYLRRLEKGSISIYSDIDVICFHSLSFRENEKALELLWNLVIKLSKIKSKISPILIQKVPEPLLSHQLRYGFKELETSNYCYLDLKGKPSNSSITFGNGNKLELSNFSRDGLFCKDLVTSLSCSISDDSDKVIISRTTRKFGGKLVYQTRGKDSQHILIPVGSLSAEGAKHASILKCSHGDVSKGFREFFSDLLENDISEVYLLISSHCSREGSLVEILQCLYENLAYLVPRSSNSKPIGVLVGLLNLDSYRTGRYILRNILSGDNSKPTTTPTTTTTTTTLVNQPNPEPLLEIKRLFKSSTDSVPEQSLSNEYVICLLEGLVSKRSIQKISYRLITSQSLERVMEIFEGFSIRYSLYFDFSYEMLNVYGATYDIVSMVNSCETLTDLFTLISE